MPKTGISPTPPTFPRIPSAAATAHSTPTAAPSPTRRRPAAAPKPPPAAAGSAASTRKRTPRGPSPQKTDATRQSIVDAAFAEFLEHGYARGTTVSVAQRAGLSKVTLFRYFESKEALFEAVMQRHIASASLALQSSPMEEHETVGAFLLRAVAPAMDVIDSSGRSATARLVMAEGLEFPQLAQMYRRTAHEPLVARIRHLAELAHTRGELKEPALRTYPELLLGPLWLAMMNNTVLHPEMPLDAGLLFRLQVGLLFDTAAQRSGGSPRRRKPAATVPPSPPAAPVARTKT